MKRGCSIKTIFALALALPSPQRASDWETGLTAAWSLAKHELPASTAYSAGSEDVRFTDLGGRLARRLGPGFLGLHSALYSSFGLREQVAAANVHATAFVAQKTAETGLPVSYAAGTYRASLGWNTLQLRYRVYLGGNFFVEAGAGAAQGFGSIEAAFRGSNSAGAVSATQYHRYAEWGAISSANAGISLPLADAVWLEAACEITWLWARIREPNIFAQGELTLSQTFFRPTAGIALKF